MTPSALIACALLTVHDGDTVRCDGELMRIIGDGAPYVSGVDTPELSPHAECPEEHQMGVIAAARLAELVATPGLTVEDSGERDRYGRPLVRLRLADGRTAGQVLLEEGLAVVWTPGYSAAWCGR
ncbi:MAG: hypothetical protein AUK37_01655 [Rhodobacterales bacterium CG2_30_65_12]|nr:MAG: hypothetical protein AUK37_01655 [Rhodobacterales bacterium CG2_30_65_12]